MEKTEIQTEIEKNILAKAEAEGYGVTENLSSIARAKGRFYGMNSWQLCPCDKIGERYCISPLCKEEIEKYGVCHCNLYKRS